MMKGSATSNKRVIPFIDAAIVLKLACAMILFRAFPTSCNASRVMGSSVSTKGSFRLGEVRRKRDTTVGIDPDLGSRSYIFHVSRTAVCANESRNAFLSSQKPVRPSSSSVNLLNKAQARLADQ